MFFLGLHYSDFRVLDCMFFLGLHYSDFRVLGSQFFYYFHDRACSIGASFEGQELSECHFKKCVFGVLN